MTFMKIFMGVAAYAVAYVQADETAAGTVHVLTTANFDDFIKENDEGKENDEDGRKTTKPVGKTTKVRRMRANWKSKLLSENFGIQFQTFN
jgi:hypothetical protein